MFRVVYKRHRAGLSAEITGALLWMPRLERQMAVFVAAADESDGATQRGPFLYGGYVAKFTYWTESFTPAWQERLLNGNPVLPYFHMTEVNSPKGREKYGLEGIEADRRIEEAVNVIRSSGGLYLCTTEMDGGHFRDVFKDFKIPTKGKQPGVYRFEPDYLAFLGFAFAALEYVGREHPDADKVNFVVERKPPITHHLGDFHDSMTMALEHIGRKNLIRYLGDLLPGEKEQTPLQAADTAVWHIRKFKAFESTRTDERRLAFLLHGRTFSQTGLKRGEMDGLNERAKAQNFPSPFTPKPKRAIGGASSGEAV